MSSEFITILTTSLFFLFLLGIISVLLYTISKWANETDRARGASDQTASFCISHSGANLCLSGNSSPRCSNARNRAVLIVSGDSCSRVEFELETSWNQWRAGKEGEFTSRMRKTGKRIHMQQDMIQQEEQICLLHEDRQPFIEEISALRSLAGEAGVTDHLLAALDDFKQQVEYLDASAWERKG